MIHLYLGGVLSNDSKGRYKNGIFRGGLQLQCTPIKEISDFLYKFKIFAQNIKCFSFVYRKKNLQDIMNLDITPEQSVEIIKELTYKNYVSGPQKDIDYPDRDVWVFGCENNGHEIYIKLSGDFSHNVAKCISFHKSDRSLSYPHK